MKTPVKDLTDEAIQKRLDFGNTILAQLEEHGKEAVLPALLASEYEELLLEQHRRQKNIHGDGV